MLVTGSEKPGHVCYEGIHGRDGCLLAKVDEFNVRSVDSGLGRHFMTEKVGSK